MAKFRKNCYESNSPAIISRLVVVADIHGDLIRPKKILIHAELIKSDGTWLVVARL